MTAYAQVDRGDVTLHQVIGLPDAGGFGPPSPPPEDGAYDYYQVETTNFWGSPPSSTCVLKWNDGAPEWAETYTIEQLKARKNDEINACREARNTDSFQFNGKAIRCKPLDRSDIDGTNGYVALFGEFPDGWQGGWKAADNTYVAIPTITEWKAFYKAMVDTGNANFKHAQQLKALLAAAETPEQIAAIKWGTPNVEP